MLTHKDTHTIKVSLSAPSSAVRPRQDSCSECCSADVRETDDEYGESKRVTEKDRRAGDVSKKFIVFKMHNECMTNQKLNIRTPQKARVRVPTE